MCEMPGKAEKKQRSAQLRTFRRCFAALLAALLLLPACCPAWAEDAPGDGSDLPFAPDGSFAEGMGFSVLTEDSFAIDDRPDDILKERSRPGRVETVGYTVSDGSGEEKSVMVYLPDGYDESEGRYNVLYILHASNGSPEKFLNPEKVTAFQCLLDNMIADGTLEPLIVAAATYFSAEGLTGFMPLDRQVVITASFPRELAEDIIPAVEGTYRSYADSVGDEGIRASRDHRAVCGFSLGGVATWYVFLQQMRAVRWFLPISEASWADENGGTGGIWDSDVSAQVLYDAVLDQGFGMDDFRLFVATGTDDEAFEISTSQMASLLEYGDMFQLGVNTGCSMMIGGTHTNKALYTYLYHILPCLFR